jgi:putative toxin-antitoxin system antitoxin component (TIGR02293 family)
VSTQEAASPSGAKLKKSRISAVAEPAAVYASVAKPGRLRARNMQITPVALERISSKPIREPGVLTYASQQLDAFVHVVNLAPPMQLLQTERVGVDAAFLGDMAKRMDVSYSRLAETVGIPKATAARKLANNEKISGAAAIALARLLAIASEIVEDSTASEAQGFDTAKWLGQWIERPQPALGGHKPAELLDTPTGVAMVTKVLGAIRSGSYQ